MLPTTPTYTYTSTGVTVGTTLVGNVSNSINWSTTTNGGSSYPYTISADPNIKGASLQVNGDADFKGDVTIKGKNLSELIENIEQRLAILHPNEKLEEKWEKLKRLGDEYRAMEKEILHAEEMWKILKK